MTRSARRLSETKTFLPKNFQRHTHTHTHARLCSTRDLAVLICLCQIRPSDVSVIYIGLTHTNTKKRENVRKTEQIVEDRAEPQQIVATRPLYCLQHPLPIQVVCKRFFPAHIVIAIHEVDSRPFRPLPVPRQLWYTSIRDALFLLISYKRDQHHRFQHRFWLRGVQPLSSVW